MNKIITISREYLKKVYIHKHLILAFGSGGREIGKRLADELGIRYYDREIITEIAKETGMTEQYIKNKTFATFNNLQSNQTEILVKQQEVIKKIAEKGNCIIVGRGANIILKDYETINIFVYADMESKIKRCREKIKASEFYRIT